MGRINYYGFAALIILVLPMRKQRLGEENLLIHILVG
jgi:hypothetical protein